MMIKAQKLFPVLALLALSIPVWAEDKANPVDKAPSQFAKLNDIRVHYKSIGTGDTALVFVHGWTCNMNFWRYHGRGQADHPGRLAHGVGHDPRIDRRLEHQEGR